MRAPTEGHGRPARLGPRKLTVAILILLVALTPVLIITMLVLNLPSPLQSLSQHQLPTSSPLAPAKSGTNSSALCANITKYYGLDATDTSHANASSSFPVFSIEPGGAAEMCISFYNDNFQPVTLNLGEVVSVGNYRAATFPNGSTKLEFVSAGSSVAVAPAQPTLTLSGSKTSTSPGAAGGTLAPNKAVVAFRLNATDSASGTYFLNIAGVSPVSCQGEFRLAVGLAFTRTNATGPYFALPSHVGSCSAGMGVVHNHVYGVQGMDITYLNCGLFICDVNRPPG